MDEKDEEQGALTNDASDVVEAAPGSSSVEAVLGPNHSEELETQDAVETSTESKMQLETTTQDTNATKTSQNDRHQQDATEAVDKAINDSDNHPSSPTPAEVDERTEVGTTQKETETQELQREEN